MAEVASLGRDNTDGRRPLRCFIAALKRLRRNCNTTHHGATESRAISPSRPRTPRRALSGVSRLSLFLLQSLNEFVGFRDGAVHILDELIHLRIHLDQFTLQR